VRTLTITPIATADDREQVAALLHDYLMWLDAATGIDLAATQPDVLGDLARLANADDDPGHSMVLARRGALAVGTVAVRWHGDGEAELKRLYVRPIARNAGIADRLVDDAIRRAGDRGCHRVWLETLPGAMDRAVAVYRRHGFVPTAHPPHLSVPGVVVMERRLASGIRCA
jgi:ribosomal protein S18 acetylase RimI-like enzyme